MPPPPQATFTCNNTGKCRHPGFQCVKTPPYLHPFSKVVGLRIGCCEEEQREFLLNQPVMRITELGRRTMGTPQGLTKLTELDNHYGTRYSHICRTIANDGWGGFRNIDDAMQLHLNTAYDEIEKWVEKKKKARDRVKKARTAEEKKSAEEHVDIAKGWMKHWAIVSKEVSSVRRLNQDKRLERIMEYYLWES